MIYLYEKICITFDINVNLYVYGIKYVSYSILFCLILPINI
jgi:hypothetical protein